MYQNKTGNIGIDETIILCIKKRLFNNNGLDYRITKILLKLFFYLLRQRISIKNHYNVNLKYNY